MADDLLMWVDIETTGLKVANDRILEVACVPTTATLELLDEGLSVVLSFNSVISSPVVRQMHTDNGLLDEAKTGIWSFEAQKILRSYVESFAEAGTVPMCGSTIGFDRKFCERYLPDFESWFFYRSIDVSTVKELWRRWFPESGVAPSPEKAHRALADCLQSIEELKWYRTQLSEWYRSAFALDDMHEVQRSGASST